MQGVGVIERAFQIAGECGSLAEVRRRLLREGYLQVEAHTVGRQIRQEIKVRLDPKLRAVEIQRGVDATRAKVSEARPERSS